ncbi:MAG: fumarylacetoacetate hydrolase family protein [Corynebacterium sp.]|uniref:fumarylacetoacetate hydrolase family protein n=1 Tax=unclassified Corynebacterium TaxID=2624378 RepID=UPI002649558C|nr:fumarylacetoacetate hydrolase family protein [Corynebacterium sp.]MDN5582715.1 fumarylacetoacetate hydrolase family protein [Corynebacterium sp.]MDN5719856.1 fumarylacetoacetate hydrolase family protein [Corynebacterium sp.]MDN6325372.1 fumarylacetoacetate hydrolase family protein [Corynebacterium sp.]MDN6510040.1 fumarylacetoacetate hydrolase family protein [Corynebacterium sp.]
MKLATVRIDGSRCTIQVDGVDDAPNGGGVTGRIVDRRGLGALLTGSATGSSSGIRGAVEAGLRRDGDEVTVPFADLLPVVPSPSKIFCVGLNYREHIEEMGHPIPDHPTLFVKYPSALTAPYAEVTVPEGMTEKADYEGELAVVIGSRLPGAQGGATAAEARAAIGGYAVMNDFSQRDWQYRTQQWLQGKNLDRSSAFGPWLTVADDYDPVAEGAVLRTWVNGDLRQEHSTADLVFPPVDLVRYISNFATLEPGDVIVTGTPEGVGAGSGRFLADGDVVRIEVDGLGAVESTIRM